MSSLVSASRCRNVKKKKGSTRSADRSIDRGSRFRGAEMEMEKNQKRCVCLCPFSFTFAPKKSFKNQTRVPLSLRCLMFDSHSKFVSRPTAPAANGDPRRLVKHFQTLRARMLVSALFCLGGGSRRSQAGDFLFRTSQTLAWALLLSFSHVGGEVGGLKS